MKKLALLMTALTLFAAPAVAAPETGKPAPDFTGTDVLGGQEFKLSDHKGKVVVLEWTNHLCPFVKKHYETGNMQKTQKKAREQGAEWVSIVSSAPELQGHVTPEEAKKLVAGSGAAPSAEILDESGEIGRLYDAKTTPHMFVIDAGGTLVYMGGIDDKPTPDQTTVEGSSNYVLGALDDLKEGRPVRTPVTQPYGCGVKYAP